MMIEFVIDIKYLYKICKKRNIISPYKIATNLNLLRFKRKEYFCFPKMPLYWESIAMKNVFSAFISLVSTLVPNLWFDFY